MGASSSGLLDELKINHIKGLVDGVFQSFSGFYRQQYSVAYLGHLHQEVEPKKEGRGLLLSQRPKYAPEEVLYQGSVKVSCWEEQGKKCRERYAVLRRDYKVEIHDSMETLKRGCAAKVVLQPAGGIVFTTEDESQAQLEKTCAGMLNGVKEDSSSAVLPPDVFAVYLHLPYRGPTCFLFQKEEERDLFLSGLKTCIRHRNLDPWHDSSYESQAYARALRLYRQDKECYESWEKLMGSEEQVLASQVMEEVLPWLQNQLQSKVKGKKIERLRQWLATVQATYTLVLEQLSAGLEALRMECRETASASQALIRSNLDEIMSSHSFLEQKVQGLVDGVFQSFSGFYRQQYSVAYLGHLHQEVEPKKEGRGLLLSQRPKYAPEEVLYQGSVKVSCWEEQGKKCRERYAVLRRDYKVEIHDSMETLKRGCAAKVVLQPAGGIVFTTEDESQAQLEKTCAGMLNGVKEDSSSAVLPPDVFAVYLHLPYRGPTCFLFQKEEERDLFLSGLKTCIRHRNLDPWHDSSYESQAYARALRLYRQDKECYESWEKLMGSEEQVLASQVMEEVLPWLQNQLQSKVKGKKIERLRQWLATVQATYTLVLEQLSAGLEALRMECRETASASQALIRSNLDEIMSSHSFLEQKVQACILEEAEEVCSDSASPYMSSILEQLTENIGAGFLSMQHTLQAQMDSAFSLPNSDDMKKVPASLGSISLDQSYKKVDSLMEKLEDLKQRFGLSSAQRLVHSAHLEMEQLLERAVYTLEQFLQSSTRYQPSQVPVKMNRAKERVLKQLDYDSRVVQRRLYQEALLEITLPTLIRRMDSKWKAELQQFEQHIFSDYSAFILVPNVFDDILRSLLSKEIETVFQDGSSRKSNNLLLDTSDLAISQYSLLGHTPPRSAPDSPANQSRHSSSTAPRDDQETAPVVEVSQTADGFPQNDAELKDDTKSDLSPDQASDQNMTTPSPLIVVTQQFDECGCDEAPDFKEAVEVMTDSDATDSDAVELSISDEAIVYYAPELEADQRSTNSDSPDSSSLVLPESTDVQAGCIQSGLSTTPENPASPEPLTSDQIPEESSSIGPPSSSHSPGTGSPVKISLGSLSEAVTPCSMKPEKQMLGQEITDRAVYLTGQIKDNWEVEKVKNEAGKEGNKTAAEGRKKERDEEEVENVEQTGGKPVNATSASPAERTAITGREQKGSEERLDDEKGAETPQENEGQIAEEVDHTEETKKEKEEVLQPEESQPNSPAELPLDSISIIRELVTEITEVETVITSCSSSSNAP